MIYYIDIIKPTSFMNLGFSTFRDKENNSLLSSRCNVSYNIVFWFGGDWGLSTTELSYYLLTLLMKDLPYALRKKSNQKRGKFRKFNSKLY